MSKCFGFKRLEAAPVYALEIGAHTYGSVKSILDNNMDRHPPRKPAAESTPVSHGNIRGPRYYH